MKFSVDKCFDCGLDLTTAEPAEVIYPGNEQALGKCPQCGRLYFMLEVTPPEPVVEPAPSKPRIRSRRASEPEVASESEPDASTKSEPEPEPEE